MIRAGVIQMRSGISREANLEAAGALIRQAASDGAQLLLTPEMTTILDKNRKRLMASAAEPLPDEERFFSELSEETGATIIVGSSPVIDPGADKVANRMMVFADGHPLAVYDKVHLFDVDLPTGESWRESSLYKAGEEAVVVKTQGMGIGLSICYDLRFPHLYRAMAQAGAEILTIPAAFTVPTGQAHWEVLLRARAIENGCFVLAAAQGGAHEDDRVTYGRSMIISPWGEVLDRLDHDDPGLAIADLDLGRVRDVRAQIPSLALERAPKIRMVER